MKSRLIALAVLFTLAACGPGKSEPAPGGVTAGEAKALGEAAEMLDERRSPAAGAGQSPAPLSPDARASAPAAATN